MSQENVEMVRASFEAWNAGDMQTFRELHDPDVILRTVEDWPEPGPHVGRDAVMRFVEQLRDTWDADAFEVISVIDVADRVVARFIWRGVGHGPESNIELTSVSTVRKGKIVYQEYFWDHAEALEAVGLPEHTSSQQGIDVVRTTWKAYLQHGVDGVLDNFAEDCVVEDFPEMPDRATYVGREGVRERDRHFAEIWGDFVIEPVEFFDCGDDVVIVTMTIRGRGKGSGVPIDAPAAFLTEVRDDKIVRDRAFTSERQAFEAAGVPTTQKPPAGGFQRSG